MCKLGDLYLPIRRFTHRGVCYFCCALIPDTEHLCEECKGAPKGLIMELEKIKSEADLDFIAEE